jgi:carbon storage regulator
MEDQIMLVLGRKVGEAIHIGDQITIKVVAISGNRVRIGIDAPQDIQIVREELLDWNELSFGEPELAEVDVEPCCEFALA